MLVLVVTIATMSATVMSSLHHHIIIIIIITTTASHLQGTQVCRPASSLSLSRGGAWLGSARVAIAALRRQTAHRALLSRAEGGASPHT